jgi:hypothetical protein
VGLCVPLSLLRNGSVKTFPRQQTIIGGFVSSTARVISKESRRLVLPTTFCNLVKVTCVHSLSTPEQRDWKRQDEQLNRETTVFIPSAGTVGSEGALE